MNRKTESFMRGALMLTLAALISRLLGALYKPVIARIFAPYDGKLGAVGIGLTQVPLTTYQVILSFTSVGLNIGISRLVAERMALGDVRGAKRVFRVSLLLMASLGLAASLVMWFGAPWIAGFFSKSLAETVPGFRATAPALFITSVMAAYRGLFQGFQRMTPNAVSQIVEQVVRVGSGTVFTYLFVRQSVALGAAGFNFGDVIGALAGLLYLLFLASRSRDDMWVVPADVQEIRPRTPESSRRLIRRILAVATPVAVSGAVVPLMMQADTFFVFRAFQAAGVPDVDAQAQYGLLTNAFMIAYLPAVFTAAIYTSILPAITRALTLGQTDVARKRARQAYRMTLLIAIPAQAGLYVLATGIYSLLFNDTSGGQVMAAISWAVGPIMLQQTTSGVQQGAGKVLQPLRNFLIGAVIKGVLTAWWTVPYGINGAAWATAVGFAVAALLNVVNVEQLLGRTLKTRSMVIKPAAAALAMAGAIAVVRGPLGRWAPGGHLQTLVLIAVGGAAYGLALLAVGGVKLQDLERLPGFGALLGALRGRRRVRG
ncbi:MAG TPA: polysaccharide biosynthesis protein [Symbiobacteriaceae bacterium]|nr:polysaccharide biosynthesis protein [Symbiobacteriaceae bacterium]